MCLWIYAYRRAAQTGCPTALGVELGWWYHRSHPPSLTPQSQETSTFLVPPEKEKHRTKERKIETFTHWESKPQHGNWGHGWAAEGCHSINLSKDEKMKKRGTTPAVQTVIKQGWAFTVLQTEGRSQTLGAALLMSTRALLPPLKTLQKK